MSEELYTYSRWMYCMVYHLNDLNTKYYICKQTLKESCIVHSDPSYNQASYTGFWSFLHANRNNGWRNNIRGISGLLSTRGLKVRFVIKNRRHKESQSRRNEPAFCWMENGQKSFYCLVPLMGGNEYTDRGFPRAVTSSI